MYNVFSINNIGYGCYVSRLEATCNTLEQANEIMFYLKSQGKNAKVEKVEN